jgi:hypothetical protein
LQFVLANARKPSQHGGMKQIQLQLISDGKKLGTVDLRAIDKLRLHAYAKANRVSLMNMIGIAIRFTTEPEKDSSVDLVCPEEEHFALATEIMM